MLKLVLNSFSFPAGVFSCLLLLLFLMETRSAHADFTAYTGSMCSILELLCIWVFSGILSLNLTSHFTTSKLLPLFSQCNILLLSTWIAVPLLLTSGNSAVKEKKWMWEGSSCYALPFFHWLQPSNLICLYFSPMSSCFIDLYYRYFTHLLLFFCESVILVQTTSFFQASKKFIKILIYFLSI